MSVVIVGKKYSLHHKSTILALTDSAFFFSAEQVVGINSREQKVKLDDGAEIGYDKLLLAPGWYLDLLIDLSSMSMP